MVYTGNDMPDGVQLKVKDVMTKEVIAVDVNDTLDIIASLFEKFDFEGFPVIDAEHKLVGVVNARDLILQSKRMHLPTILKLMDQVVRGRGDVREIEDHFGKLRTIRATSIMEPRPVAILENDPIEEATRVFADYEKVNPLSVVDAQGKLVGVLSRYDIIKLFNQQYLEHVVGKARPGGDLYAEFPTRSQRDVEEAVERVQEDFVLVSKRRPLIWRYVAIAMFATGLIAATALVIRIVQRGG